MKARQPRDKPEKDEAVYEEYNTGGFIASRNPEIFISIYGSMHNKRETQRYHQDTLNSRTNNERKKVSIITLPYAGSNPRAMMVELLNAIIAN